MNTRTILCAALVAASATLVAQEPGGEQAMPSPKHEQHEALKALAGIWETHYRMEAMPEAGIAEPVESKGYETAELLCDGIWLKSTVHGAWADQPFEAVFLVGYDPFQKKYVGVWVGSNDDEPGASMWDGSYDDRDKVWTWRGNTPMGPMRSTFTLIDADHTVETGYIESEGIERKCMEVKRTRVKAGRPIDAALKPAPDPSREQALLHEDVGVWNAEISFAAPGEEGTRDEGVERVTSICNGRWMWSDFEGTMAGMPFAGHTLYGYDAKQEKYVSFWIDSTGPVLSVASGTYDEDESTFTFAGNSADPFGNPMTMNETIVRKGGQRIMNMEFKTAEATMNMTIRFQRAKK